MGFEIFDGVRHFLGYRNNGLELAEISVFRAVGHHLAVVSGFPSVANIVCRRVNIINIGDFRLSLGRRHGFDSIRRYVVIEGHSAEPL